MAWRVVEGGGSRRSTPASGPGSAGATSWARAGAANAKTTKAATIQLGHLGTRHSARAMGFGRKGSSQRAVLPQLGRASLIPSPVPCLQPLQVDDKRVASG